MEAIQGILDIPYKKTAMAVVSYLSEEQMKILLSLPDADTKEGFRDQVMLSLLYDTGARVQELADSWEREQDPAGPGYDKDPGPVEGLSGALPL